MTPCPSRDSVVKPALKQSHMKQTERLAQVDRVQLHTEKRDPLRRGESALFPVDPKPQPAEVTEHHVPVFAQLCSRLGQYEPVVEVVENANASFPQKERGQPPRPW